MMRDMIKVFPSATYAWREVLERILIRGDTSSIAPRGQQTTEVLHNSVGFDASRPVVVCPPRKLNYSFSAAEALWILSGDNSVAGISPYNKNIAAFSDNSVNFEGAYGPPIAEQRFYIVESLLKDRDTRQAVLTIWERNPLPAKDVPCTVSLTFNIRHDRLNIHVFMRSSDAWLGIPYDFFNFAMVGHQIAAQYNELSSRPVAMGNVHWTAVSSHLYDRNLGSVTPVLGYLQDEHAFRHERPPIPDDFVHGIGGYGKLVKALAACRDKTDSHLTDSQIGWRMRDPL